MRFGLGIAISLILATGSEAAATSTSKSMSFEACMATIRKVASDLATAPINIVETNDVRIVRFLTVDGSVLVTCSRPDRKMVLTRSTR